MNKRDYFWLFIAGLICGAIIWLAAQAQAQIVTVGGTKEQDACAITISGNTCTFNDATGTQSNSFEMIVAGGPATVSVTITGVMRGGTSTSLATSTSTANAILSTSGGPYDKYIVTGSWTGGAAPSLTFNRTGTTAKRVTPVGTVVTAATCPAGDETCLNNLVPAGTSNKSIQLDRSLSINNPVNFVNACKVDVFCSDGVAIQPASAGYSAAQLVLLQGGCATRFFNCTLDGRVAGAGAAVPQYGEIAQDVDCPVTLASGGAGTIVTATLTGAGVCANTNFISTGQRFTIWGASNAAFNTCALPNIGVPQGGPSLFTVTVTDSTHFTYPMYTPPAPSGGGNSTTANCAGEPASTSGVTATVGAGIDGPEFNGGEVRFTALQGIAMASQVAAPNALVTNPAVRDSYLHDSTKVGADFSRSDGGEASRNRCKQSSGTPNGCLQANQGGLLKFIGNRSDCTGATCVAQFKQGFEYGGQMIGNSAIGNAASTLDVNYNYWCDTCVDEVMQGNVSRDGGDGYRVEVNDNATFKGNSAYNAGNNAVLINSRNETTCITQPCSGGMRGHQVAAWDALALPNAAFTSAGSGGSATTITMPTIPAGCNSNMGGGAPTCTIDAANQVEGTGALNIAVGAGTTGVLLRVPISCSPAPSSVCNGSGAFNPLTIPKVRLKIGQNSGATMNAGTLQWAMSSNSNCTNPEVIDDIPALLSTATPTTEFDVVHHDYGHVFDQPGFKALCLIANRSLQTACGGAACTNIKTDDWRFDVPGQAIHFDGNAVTHSFRDGLRLTGIEGFDVTNNVMTDNCTGQPGGCSPIMLDTQFNTSSPNNNLYHLINGYVGGNVLVQNTSLNNSAGIMMNNNTTFSITSISAGATATLTCSATCAQNGNTGFTPGMFVDISGYTPACYNGIQGPITTPSTTTITFPAAAGCQAGGAAGGTVYGAVDNIQGLATNVCQGQGITTCAKFGSNATFAPQIASATLAAGTVTASWPQNFQKTPKCVATWNSGGTFTGIIKCVATNTGFTLTSSVGTDTGSFDVVGYPNPQ